MAKGRRAFYRIDPGEMPTDAETEERVPATALGARVLRETSSYLWLYSATDPNPELEQLGAERLAGTWGEWYEVMGGLSPGTRDAVMEVVVGTESEDPETGEPGHRRMSVAEARERELAAVSRELVPVTFHHAETAPEQEGLDAVTGEEG